MKAPIIIVFGSYPMRSEGRVPDVSRCEARDLHPGLAHEKETVAYLMPRQTHAIDYDPFNPP